MAFSLNQAVIAGNVSSEPVLKYTPAGNAVLNFNVATNRSVKQNDNWEDVPTYHRIVVWGKIAEWLGNNMFKGDPVMVSGRIENRSYQDNSGQTKYISEIVADTVIPHSRNRNQAGAGGNVAAKRPTQPRDEYAEAAADIFDAPPPRTVTKPAAPAPTPEPTPQPPSAPGTEEINVDDIPF